MKRKLITSLLLGASIFTLASCSGREKLLVLNWGEYINDEVVTLFEDTYNCDVVMSLADSNELFYSKIKSGTTVYDIVVPSDYMVEKMAQNDLLEEIDFSKLTNYKADLSNFLPGVRDIIRDMNASNPGISNYFVPYFWGTWGLMYNKRIPSLEEKITTSENPWEYLFNKNTDSLNLQTGMYDTPRYAYSASMFYKHLNVNEENENNLKVFEEVMRNASFDQYGTDTLKKAVSSGNLDLAFMWTGDFLDMLYTELTETTDVSSLKYDIVIPEETIAFMDNLVITKKARHKDLAYKFIDFLLDKDNAYLNATVVGYCTPVLETYNMIVNKETPDPIKYHSIDTSDTWLTNFSYAVSTYYPIINDGNKRYKGTVLKNFSREYLNEIITINNNIKV